MDKTLRQVRAADYPTVYRSISRDSTNIEFEYVYFGLWDVLIFMFIGMAFYKTGVITGAQPAKVYWWMFVVGLGVGLPLSYLRLQPLIEHQFDFYTIIKNEPFEFYEISR